MASPTVFFIRSSTGLKLIPAALIKLNLNTAAEKELARHPYIGKYAAAGIIRYRTEVSGIKNMNELKINGIDF